MEAHMPDKKDISEVRDIRRKYRDGYSAGYLAEEYDTAKSAIYNAVKGDTYTALPGPVEGRDYNMRRGHQHLSDEDIVLLREEAKIDQTPMRHMARREGLTVTAMIDILAGYPRSGIGGPKAGRDYDKYWSMPDEKTKKAIKKQYVNYDVSAFELAKKHGLNYDEVQKIIRQRCEKQNVSVHLEDRDSADNIDTFEPVEVDQPTSVPVPYEDEEGNVFSADDVQVREPEPDSTSESMGVDDVSNSQVWCIRELYKAQVPVDAICDAFGVDEDTVTDIVKGKTHRFVKGPVEGVDY